MQRSGVLFVLSAASVCLAAVLADAGASFAGDGPRPHRRPLPVLEFRIAPGVQGAAAGNGTNVAVSFALIDRRRRRVDVELQWGVAERDLSSGDPDARVVAEFRPATEDRSDDRDSRLGRGRRLFTSAPGDGALQTFVWDSYADVRSARYVPVQYLVTEQGRLVPDDAHPGELLLDASQPGVVVRARPVLRVGRRRIVGKWVESWVFPLDNTVPPRMTIDAAVPHGDGTVDLAWTAFDENSEDLNGNGMPDPGEDRDGDGVVTIVQVGVAFDVHRVAPGEDPTTWSQAEIEAAEWVPCTRAAGLGDSDSFRESDPARAVFGTPGGSPWTFVWDAAADVGDDAGPFVFRARCVNDRRSRSDAVHLLDPVSR